MTSGIRAGASRPARDPRKDPIEQQVAHDLVDELLRIPGVADLDGGHFGEIALYYPRERVRGLRLVDGGQRLEVNLVVDVDPGFTTNLMELADQVRAVVSQRTGLGADVVFADATRS